MTFAMWWAEQYGKTGEVPERFFNMMRDAYARGKDDERENAMLRQGDTCARQCEGTAYRIEGRRVRHHLTELAKLADRAALVLATLEAENSDEEEQIQQIIDGISTWVPPAILGDVQAA